MNVNDSLSETMTHQDLIAKMNEHLEERGHAFYDPARQGMLLTYDDYANAHLRCVESDYFHAYTVGLHSKLDIDKPVDCTLQRGRNEGYYLTIQYDSGLVIYSIKLFDRAYGLRLLSDITEFLMDI